MSANLEKSDTLPRVTRSMRRMNSSDSINLDTERPETPTGRLRNTKKMEAIDESVLTPSRRTRGGSIQRNLISEESTTPASPLRRTTRRMSSDNNIELVSSPARLTRAKRNATESEDDEVVFVGETAVTPRTKSLMKKRLSVAVVKLEGVVEEEQEQPEIESNEKTKEHSENQQDLNKSSDSTNELELRNRSISKSPCVNLNNSNSSNDAISTQDSIDNEMKKIFADDKKSPSPTKTPKSFHFRKSVNGSFSETSLKVSENGDTSISRKSDRKSLSSIAETISSDSQKSTNNTSIQEKTNDSIIENENSFKNIIKSPRISLSKIKDFKDIEVYSPASKMIQNDKEIIIARNELENTPADDNSFISRDSGLSVKGNEDSSFKENEPIENQQKESEELISKMMEDFVPESVEQSNDNDQKSSTLTKTPSLADKTQINPTDMTIVSDNEEESMHNSTNKHVTDMDITNFIDNKNTDLGNKIVNANMEGNTWNQSVRGASKQIDTLTQPEKEIIHNTSIQKTRKDISSDESESEDEKKLFLDDEAEQAGTDEESITKSERDYLEENEIHDHGESLGSEDSDQTDEEDDATDESDSFIDKNEDISDSYSLDSHEQLIEELEANTSKTKRQSRIIAKFSSSEDEAPIKTSVEQKSPAKTQELPINSQTPSNKSCESLSPIKTQAFNVSKSSSSEDQSMASAENSPLKTQSAVKLNKSMDSDDKKEESPIKTQKIEKSSRKSLPNVNEMPKNQKLDKKSRKSLPVIPSLTEQDGDDSSTVEASQQAKKNTRKSIQTEQEAKNSPIKTQPSSTINRESISKVQEWTVRNNKIEDDQNISSDINSTKSIDNLISSLLNTDTSEKESTQEDVKVRAKKRKRESDVKNSDTKRFREMSPNESEALHMDDQSKWMENNDDVSMEEDVATQKPQKEIKKKKKKEKVVQIDNESSSDGSIEDSSNEKSKKDKYDVDLNSILERCNKYMEKTKEEKKANMALKREKKAKKLEKKKMEMEMAENNVQENSDSLAGENKENSIKKKKKNKTKKLRFADDVDDGKKEDLSSKLDKLQQKLELKRQRKKEKKLAKLAQQNEMDTSDESKHNQKSEKVAADEPKASKKSIKNALKIQEEPLLDIEMEKPKKKSKKIKEIVEVSPPEVKIKKSKKSSELTAVPQQVLKISDQEEQIPAVKEKKKSKKRPISEIIDDFDTETIEKPKPKKKLNILKQTENPLHVLSHKKLADQAKNAETMKYPSNVTSKLNQIIPKGLGMEENQSKKKKNHKKVLGEQKKPSKRPIRTTAGTFIEESIVPYTFKSTEYKPIKFGSSATTNFSVVSFSAKKQPKKTTNIDYKMQAMMKRSKNRDKSIKNLKNLM